MIRSHERWATHIVVITAGVLVCLLSPRLSVAADPVAANEIPRTQTETVARVAQLRQTYAPFLRSLPEKTQSRQRQGLSDETWRLRYEFRDTDNSKLPEQPAWYVPELDDSAWKLTTVPEWRYESLKGRTPISCVVWYRKRFRTKLPESDKRVFLVFKGVDWRADVWLNGKKVGRHSVYFEPFRFDVTELIQEENTLAVRVSDGPRFGEPAAYWTLMPVPSADQMRYVRDRSQSVVGQKRGDSHIGSGYGIHREVYLETTGSAVVTGVFARGFPKEQLTRVTVQADALSQRSATLCVEIMPENFEGRSYVVEKALELPPGVSEHAITVPMPEARLWFPDRPYLYRCRASFECEGRRLDVNDAVFGYRSLDMVSEASPSEKWQPGTLLLNGKPVFLRGTNIQGLNTLWYWREEDKLLDVVLMLKAAHFNTVRSCQHVMYPEVRELLDRIGIMSEQDVGSRYPKLGKQCRSELIHASAALAQQCYNNPGVVLLSCANETSFDPTDMIREILAVDPQRIVKPISGHPYGGTVLPHPGREGYKLTDELWKNVLADFHPYWGWYGYVGQIWEICRPLKPGCLVTVGEYGAEALDGYQTMQSYPSHWGPRPAKDADVLWGHVQVKKSGKKQLVGLRGRKPKNLGEYIEASQNYQADVISESTKGWRISPRRIAGYFHFHFIDVLPANWPKSIVSHDLTPKKGYYAMAQINQPVAPLPRLTNRGQTMQLWVANDLSKALPGCRLGWKVADRDAILLEGEQGVDVPATDAVHAGDVDLALVPTSTDVVTITLVLRDASGKVVSRYVRDEFIKAWRMQDNLFVINEK